MATLTIKNLDPSVHETLKREAAREGRSLASLLASLLDQAARDRQRRALMREQSEELELFVRGLPPSSDAVELLREDREQR